MTNEYSYRENWYALYLSIVRKKEATESLKMMGIREGMRRTIKSNNKRIEA